MQLNGLLILNMPLFGWLVRLLRDGKYSRWLVLLCPSIIVGELALLFQLLSL